MKEIGFIGMFVGFILLGVGITFTLKKDPIMSILPYIWGVFLIISGITYYMVSTN